MEDMLRTLENGKRNLSPRTRSKIYEESSKNAYLAQKQLEQQHKIEQDRLKDEKFQNRQMQLKKKLEAFQQQKRQDELRKFDNIKQ